MSPDAIGKWERGDNRIKLENLERLAGALNCLVGDILPNSGASSTTDEFQPIAAALMGLSKSEIRDAILNLASQARLMAAWHNAQPARDSNHQTISSVPPYNTRPTNTERVDTEDREEFGAGPPMGNHANAQNGASGTAASKPTATAAARKTGKQR